MPRPPAISLIPRFAALAALLFLSCEIFKPGEPIEFTTIEGCQILPVSCRSNCIFQDSVSLRAFWIKYSPDTLWMRIPRVDLDNSTLICVFMGSWPTSGYETAVEDVRAFDDRLVVTIREEDWDGILPIDTYPQHLVTIPKTDLRIEFEYDKMVTYDGDLDF